MELVRSMYVHNTPSSNTGPCRFLLFRDQVPESGEVGQIIWTLELADKSMYMALLSVEGDDDLSLKYFWRVDMRRAVA